MAIIELTKEMYDNVVLKSERTALIDFFATWCGPCKMLSPVIDSIAEERTDIDVYKCDVDKEPALATEFAIMSVPTLAVIKGGKVAAKSTGMRPKPLIIAMIDGE